MHEFRNGRYDGFNSSDEILAAIEEIAGAKLTPSRSVSDFDDEPAPSAADLLWQDATPEQMDRIISRAWELADPETEELYWGAGDTIRRP